MIVNSKIALSFAAGAVLASGVVYVALKPSGRPHPAFAVSSVPAPVAKAVPPAVVPQPAPVAGQNPPPPAEPPAKIAEAPAVSAPRPASAVPPHKPSPMPPAHPAEIAQTTPPPDDVPPSARTDPQPAPAAPAPTPPAAEPAPEPVPEAVAEVPVSNPAPPPVNRVTLRQGMIIAVRLSEGLSSDTNEKGDSFFATLDAPLAADGFVIAERGARAEGRIVDVVRGGRGNGAAHLVLQLTNVRTSDGQRVPIETATFDRKADTSAGEDAAKVGGGAVLGAVIGALAGGGKGAGIGALAGGAAGAGGAVLTHGRTARMPVESRISFRLQHDVTVTERLR